MTDRETLFVELTPPTRSLGTHAEHAVIHNVVSILRVQSEHAP